MKAGEQGGGGVAFLFPGQGSQRPGMGRDLYDRWAQARAIFDDVSRVAGGDIAAACFEESGRALESTAVAQPALLAVELSCLAVLRDAHVRPAAVAGHSLGEFAAWAACGALEQSDVIRLVVIRARLMEQAAGARPGAMAAIIGLETVQVERVCREASGVGLVVPANFNGPGQVVISGETAAVEAAMRFAMQRGAKARLLPVAGAFHSSLMSEAAERFARALGEVNAFGPAAPAVANATGDWVKTAADVRAAAAAQMTSPVRWESCMRKLLERGIRRFCELGPGSVLAGLTRRMDSSVKVMPADSADGLKQIMATPAHGMPCPERPR